MRSESEHGLKKIKIATILSTIQGSIFRVTRIGSNRSSPSSLSALLMLWLSALSILHGADI